MYEEIKKKAGIGKVGPENIERFKEKLREIGLSTIAQKAKNEHQFFYLKTILFDFFLRPNLSQKKVLSSLKEIKPPTSIRRIHLAVGLGNLYSYQKVVSTRILKEMGLIEVKELRFKIVKINRELFKKYWPDIDDWKLVSNEVSRNKTRAKKGEQMEKFFLILAEKVKEKGFGPEIAKVIKEINRTDFKERGWDIKRRSLHNLQQRILKMPIQKFRSLLEKVTAEKSAFYFFEILLKLRYDFEK